jgi:hypothetical protein
MGRKEAGASHLITNELGGAWAVPGPGEDVPVPEPGHGQSEMQYFSLSPELSLTERQNPEKIFLRLLRGWSSFFF